MSLNQTVRDWARRIKRDAVMLWFARKHPDTPLLAKAICVITVLYALSPIDLIPDFIPVLGYVDDALLLPALIWLTVRLLPQHVILSCRQQAEEWIAARGVKPKSYAGGIVIVALWCVAAYFCWRWLRSF
jgi:uncharacterized membrane protein YkvA (DUF1232 family)